MGFIKASSTRSSLKPSSSWEVKLIYQTRVTQPWGESWVTSNLIIAHFGVCPIYWETGDIHTQVFGESASLWRIAIAGRVIHHSVFIGKGQVKD